MLVVLDTNVLLSAILFGGKPRQVLDAAISGNIRMCISNSILSKLQGILQRPKFIYDLKRVQNIISEMTSVAEWVVPKKHFNVIDADPTDNHVIDCAIEAGADYIIGGDTHLLDLGKYRKTLIMNANSFVRVLAKETIERT